MKELQNSIKKLKNLKSLQLSYNQLEKLPQFLLSMKTMGLVDMYSQKLELGKSNYNNENYMKNDLNPPLTKVNLRSNQLKGSIILGNYGVSINKIRFKLTQ